MARDFRVNLGDFENDIDWSRAVRMPRPCGQTGPASRETARAIIARLPRTPAAQTVGSIQELLGPPPGRLIFTGKMDGTTFPGVVTNYTVAFGPAFNVGAGVQVGAGGGVYWWSRAPYSDELGLWGSVGVGVTTNLAFSIGGQVSIWLGPAPMLLKGECLAVAADFSPGIAGLSFYLFFSVPPGGFLLTPGMKLPPSLAGWKFALTGFGFGLSAGFSALPFDISVTSNYTAIRPF